RIASSKAIIKGFNAINDNIKSVYHVLMPTKKGESPYIYVGEIDYSPIDIENIQILGATTKNKITNFKFTDGKHKYKYTSADSQLLMNFENKNIVLDKWKINYIDNPIKVFESINSEEESKAKLDYEMSV
ncbi:hypothetical protein RPO40_00425, partial [Mammaliicoccus fleurettii]|nr:hypothetical protein [Mammaliicoccus fleurettii]